MAVRPIRRMPNQIDTGDYYDDTNEGYFNFSSFKGINSNKNFIGIDQQSFEDAKNVYVNQDNQLSTRPIVKRINVLPANETVVQILKVNSLVIYHTFDGTNYHIRFQYDGYWYANPDGEDYIVKEKVIVSWFQDKYILFTIDNIFGFSYNYERAKTQPTNAIGWFTAEEVIYIPVQSDNEASQEKNIFTNASVTRYIFSKDVSVDTVALIDKTVTVRIDNEPAFTITFRENNEEVFTKPLGSIVATKWQVSQTQGNMLCEDANKTLYYSLDGLLFEVFHMHDEENGIYNGIYCLSDDGAAIYQAIGFSYEYNSTASGTTCIVDKTYIYEMDLSANGFMPSGTWTTYTAPTDTTLKDIKMNNVATLAQTSDGPLFDMSVKILGMGGTPRKIHSMEKGVFAILYNCDSLLYGYKNTVNTYSETGKLGPGWDAYSNADYSLYGDSGYDVLIMRDGSNISIQYPLHSYNVSRIFYNPAGGYILGVMVTGTFYIARYETSSDYMFGKIRTDKDEIGFTNPFGDDYDELVLHIDYDIWRKVSDGVGSYNDMDNVAAIRTRFTSGKIVNIAAYADSTADRKLTNTVSDIATIESYNRADNSLTYTYSGDDIDDWHNNDGDRGRFPWTSTNSDSKIVLSEEYNSTLFRMSDDENSILTDKYYYFENQVIPLLQRKGEDNLPYSIVPLIANSEHGDMVYYSNNTIYSNNYAGEIYVDLSNSSIINYLLPDRIETFIGAMSVKVFSIENKLYWTSTEGDVGKLYVKENDVFEFEDYITNIVTFSQTSLGIFLEDSVYEFMYDTSNSVYRVAATKLQLGCKKGSDVLLSYDGSSILLTNIKGLSALTYQDFVQSTEQVYNYLTNNIMDRYDDFAVSPIKLYQYKDWYFMYRQDSNLLYVYDARNASWWAWEYLYNITQIIYDGNDLLILLNNILYKIDFNAFSVYDDDVHPFDWFILSQKLHFNAPNYYKHIKQINVITSQPGNLMRYKLYFKNYRDLNNLTSSDTVEFEIEQLNTLIKRVTFMKTNAFQFQISNDVTNTKPMPFVVPDIAIQYRITERVR
jgi:hypothetical protein